MGRCTLDAVQRRSPNAHTSSFTNKILRPHWLLQQTYYSLPARQCLQRPAATRSWTEGIIPCATKYQTPGMLRTVPHNTTDHRQLCPLSPPLSLGAQGETNKQAKLTAWDIRYKIATHDDKHRMSHNTSTQSRKLKKQRMEISENEEDDMGYGILQQKTCT